MKPNAGDKVQVVTSDKTFEGVLMPQEKDTTVIKLSSGYNIGIENKKIKKIEVLEKYKEKKIKKEVVVGNKKLPLISILHTGGTIASKVDYQTGAVIAKFTPEEILSMFPELKEIAQIDSKLVGNMWSENMRFSHYKIFAQEVEKAYKKGSAGVIITHGTDTLHYTSAALSFILEKLPIPVILVAAQRSSDRGSSDAAMNLICAAEFIANADFAGVAICMHNSSDDSSCVIIDGTKARKLHTSRRDAFKPVNDIPIAKIDYDSRKIVFLKDDYKKADDKLLIKSEMEDKVAIIKSRPNMFAKEIDAYKDFKGIVLEGTGLGHFPTDSDMPENKENIKILKSISELAKNKPVVMTSQCIFGRVNMNVYSAGRNLQDVGVIPAQDMSTETAYIKLAWLLANYPKEARELFSQNLRGEITECSSEKEFLDGVGKKNYLKH